MRRWPALDVTFATPDVGEAVQLILADFPASVVHEVATEPSPSHWRVFFPDAPARDAASGALRRTLTQAALTIAPVDLDDEDWAARSQASLRALRVGDIVVAPPWDVPAEPGSVPPAPGYASAGRPPIVVVIEPSMGFGTGHHATTRLCLAALQHLDLRGCTVLDVGTGSGVLALAASRLGARQVLAIDDDPDAIESARRSLVLNPGGVVTLGTVDLRRAALRPFDVLVANLTSGLLLQTSAELTRYCRQRLVLSGVTAADMPDILHAYAPWTLERQAQEDEWVGVILAPPAAATGKTRSNE